MQALLNEIKRLEYQENEAKAEVRRYEAYSGGKEPHRFDPLFAGWLDRKVALERVQKELSVLRKQAETPTEANTVFITVKGFEFRIWFNQVDPANIFWQVDRHQYDTEECDNVWSYFAWASGLTEAFNKIRTAVGL